VLPTHDKRELAAIYAGGALGALLRVWVVRALPHGEHSWPWATFAVNVAGAFMLGYFVTRLQERLPISSYRRPFVGTGVCGALTTFSTVQVELYTLVRAHQWALAGGYAVATICASFVAFAGATAVVRRVRVLA
jgi:CrcB protein